jgi:hypothetical protein
MSTEPIHASAKLKLGSDIELALRSIGLTDGVIHAESMFPGETDAELATLVSVVLDTRKARKALASIKRRSYVESATRLAPRVLIR